MSARIAIGACFFSLGTLGTICANAILHRMIDEINRRSVGGKPISHEWFWIGKFMHIIETYSVLYPLGKLQIYLRVSIVAQTVGVAGAAVCLLVRFR